VSQFRILFREFLFRIVDIELIAPDGDIKKLLGRFAGLLVFLSLWFAVGGLLNMADKPLPPPLRLMMVWTIEHFVIATTMLVVGIFAVLSWNSTFLDRRDVLILAPLPINLRRMFLAKVAAVASAVGLTILCLHVAAGLVWPIVFAKQSAALTAPALTYDAALPPLSAVSMQAALDRDLAEAQKPGGALGPGTGAGVAIGVYRNGLHRVFAYGTAKADSVFAIASISKTFTALLLAQMVVQGKVRLDEPVRGLLPEGTVDKPNGPEITLLDLATHHSGLPPMPDNLDVRDPDAWTSYTIDDLYAYLHARGVSKPDDPEFEYSNLGFTLLGAALANRAGVGYADLLRREVIDPLGMRDTTLTLTPEQQHRIVRAYDPDGRPAFVRDYGAFDPAAGLRSTAGDLVTYLESNLHPERFASGALAGAILGTQVLQADVQDAMRIGLSWVYNPKTGVYWHNGTATGYSSYVFFHRKDDYAAVVLLNHIGSLSTLLPDHIRQRFAGEPAVSLGNVVIPGSTGVLSVPRSLGAYWIAVSAGGIFIFSCVLVLQGIAAQILPRRHFLRLSSWLQVAIFCLFVAGYFLEPSPATTLSGASNFRLLSWLPSYWFLALFQELNGTLHPALAPFADRASVGLAMGVGGASIAYILSYFRTLRQIVEEPDILPASRRATWLPRFGTPLHTAIVRFSLRTMLRSRQHRVILAFYLSLGFAVSILFLRSPAEQQQIVSHSGAMPWQTAALPLLVSSVAMAVSWVVAIRMVFALPLELPANWIFRVLPLGGAAQCLTATRRALYVLALAPVCGITAAIFLWIWPRQPALGHIAMMACLCVFLAELGLRNFQKLPFTCSYLPGKINFSVTILFCMLLFFLIVFWAAGYERYALAHPATMSKLLIGLALAATVARRSTTAQSKSEVAELRFEEVPEPQVSPLKIYKDGATPLLRPE